MIEGIKLIESKFKGYGKDYKGSYSLSKEEMLQLLSELQVLDIFVRSVRKERQEVLYCAINEKHIFQNYTIKISKSVNNKEYNKIYDYLESMRGCALDD